MSTEITKDQILNLIGGEEGAEELMAEVVSDKIADDGFLVYVPPEHSLIEVDDDELDELAEQQSIATLRLMFADLRQKIRNALEEIFSDMKKHNDDSEIRLNKFYNVEISEEEIDLVMMAILDGVDDE